MEEKEIKEKLTREEYHVMREKGTEPPGSGEHYHQTADGTYTCKVCDAALFESVTKFDSGSGWPSFDQAIEGSVTMKNDDSMSTRRTEVVCSCCASHLGHVFSDGPKQTTGQRFCVNSLSLNFDKKMMNKKEIIFGAGCFWGVEEKFRTTPGVIETEVGYAGGKTENPSYEEVCKGDTGHAEVVRVVYNENEITTEKIIRLFYGLHDPTQIDGQGPDRGDQYRSVLFYHDENQRGIGEKMKAEDEDLENVHYTTQILAAPRFYPAEEYHQKYQMNSGKGLCY